MNSDLARSALAVALALGLSACAEYSMYAQPGDAAFGEANRQTMMAQVVDPDPVYTDEMTTSGEHAADAVDRYRNDKVKQPESIRTTNAGASGSEGD